MMKRRLSGSRVGILSFGVRRPGAIVLVAFVATVLAVYMGCSGEEGPDEEQRWHEDFEEVHLAATEIAQLTTVEIRGLPEDVGSKELYVVLIPTESDTHPNDATDPIVGAVISRGEKISLITPLMDADGMTADLVISDGSRKSPVHTVDFEPLPPPKEGSYEDLVEAIDDILRASAEELGMSYPDDFETWRDEGYDGAPIHILPLLRTWSIALDPENPKALVNREPDEETLELVERILANNDLESTAQSLMMNIDGGASLFEEAREHFPPASPNYATSPFAIEKPEDLSLAMHAHAQAYESQQSFELMDEVFGTYVMIAGLLTGAKVLLAPMEITAALADGLGTAAEVSRWFLPCCIEEVEAEFDPPGGVVPYEDEPENQVSISSVKVTAQSIGVDLSRELLERALGQVLEKGVGPVVEEYFDKAREDYAESASEALLTDPLLQEILDGMEGTELVFTWEDIELVDDNVDGWVEYEIRPYAGGTATLEHVPGQGEAYLEFRLTDAIFDTPGSVLSVQPNVVQFPQGSWSHVIGDSEQIQLEEIRVSIDPSRHYVSEGPEEVIFTVSVSHARDTEVEVFGPREDFGPSVDMVAQDGDTFTVTAPQSDDFYTMTYEAQSISEGGLRGSESAPIRYGTARISNFEDDEEDDENDDEENDETEPCEEINDGEVFDEIRGIWHVRASFEGASDWDRYELDVGATSLELTHRTPSTMPEGTYDLVEFVGICLHSFEHTPTGTMLGLRVEQSPRFSDGWCADHADLQNLEGGYSTVGEHSITKRPCD